MEKVRIGLIAANRGFFSDDLAARMRDATVKEMEAAGMEAVVPDAGMTNRGTVGTYQEARTAAGLFHDRKVQGIIVAAVNFGDEQTVAVAIKESGLDVPVLIFGCQEEEVLTMSTPRRDSFCGLLSIGEALRQIGIKYTVARTPICFPSDASFKDELVRFAGVCRIVTGLRGARYGQVGARPNDFWTCRFDEKSLQAKLNVTTVTLDLSEVIGAVERMDPQAEEVKEVIKSISGYTDVQAAPSEAVNKQARFEIVLQKFIDDYDLDGLAIQCWTSLQTNLGMCSCTVMSRLGELGYPCACEADILGTLSMHALKLATAGAPVALADWNNVHNEDADLVNLWHCGVFPTSMAKTAPRMGVQEIIAGTTGRDNAWGVTEFQVKAGPVTVTRITQDTKGNFKAVVVPACFEDNRARTFGAYGWARIQNMTALYRDVLCRHFPHHTAFCLGDVSDACWEAFGNYLDMETFSSGQTVPGMWTPMPPFAEQPHGSAVPAGA